MIEHDVEQNSPEWFALRAGRVTASEAAKLITGTGKVSTQYRGYAYSLAAEKLAKVPIQEFEGNKWTERGHELEQVAFDGYKFMTGVAARKCGFLCHPEIDMGCSPDGLAENDSIMVEIKCLKAGNHLKNMHLHKVEDKIPPDYYSQVQFQLLCTGLEMCHLTLFHPDLPLYIIPIKANKRFQDELLSATLKTLEFREIIIKEISDDK